MTKKMSAKDEIKALKEQIKKQSEELQIANNKVKDYQKNVKRSFRVETTKTANNFHIGFNKLFDIVDIETEYKDLIVSSDEKETIFKFALREKLEKKIEDSLNK